MTQFGGAGGSFGPNAWLVDDMYDRFLADPDSVSESWREFFADYRPGSVPAPTQQTAPAPPPAAPSAPPAAATPAPPIASPVAAAPAAVAAPAPTQAAPAVSEEATPLRG